MKRVCYLLLVVALLATDFSSFAQTSQRPHLRRHWTETETETLWRTRYTNCDYGYYVLLESGVIGHGTHSPSPNHGFFVALPDVGKTSFASANDEERIVWVDASYGTSDDQSLVGAASEEDQITTEASGHSRVVERKSTKLAGLQAIRSTAEYASPKGAVIDEAVIAVRSGIRYTISLHTTQRDRSVDEEQFKKILNGFRLLKLPRGECSNG